MMCRCQFFQECELHPGPMGWIKRFCEYCTFSIGRRWPHIGITSPLFSVYFAKDEFETLIMNCWMVRVCAIPAHPDLTIKEDCKSHLFSWRWKLRKGTPRELLGRRRHA